MNDSAAKIVGLPDGFDLTHSLRDAKAVTLVMAFAKRSGWISIKEALLSGNASIDILVGLNFDITEPAVLSEWLRLQEKDPYRFTVRVAPLKPVFHPKVILVQRQDDSRFAIIGSGNLTGGGLSTNVECGVMLEAKAQIDELVSWQSELASTPLTAEIIEAYRPLHKEAVKANWTARRPASKLRALLRGAHVPDSYEPLSNWDIPHFLKDMNQFFTTQDGIDNLENRIEGAKSIRALLDMPTFNFTKQSWEEFYGIPEFGRIRQSYKAMSKYTNQLRKTLRILTSSNLSEDELEDILGMHGKYHVRGLGTNLVSKILTVHDRRRWPLFNARVKMTFAHYGYNAEWGATPYLRFSVMMRRILSQGGTPDFWAMDAFCEVKSRSLKKS